MDARRDGWLLLRSRWTVFLHDLLWIPVAVLLAYWVRFNLTPIPHLYFTGMLLIMSLAVPFHTVTLWMFGCYRGIWRYASIPDLMRIIKSVVLGAIATFIGAFLFARLQGVPRSVLVLYPILLALGLGCSRMLYRVLKDRWISFGEEATARALIVGAGRAGELLIRDLRRHGPFLPVALVDDAADKQGHEVQGVRVRGRLRRHRAPGARLRREHRAHRHAFRFAPDHGPGGAGLQRGEGAVPHPAGLERARRRTGRGLAPAPGDGGRSAGPRPGGAGLARHLRVPARQASAGDGRRRLHRRGTLSPDRTS